MSLLLMATMLINERWVYEIIINNFIFYNNFLEIILIKFYKFDKLLSIKFIKLNILIARFKNKIWINLFNIIVIKYFTKFLLIFYFNI